MDEKKETTSKKINLKNKKAATKALSKTTTSKNKKPTKKTSTKKTTVKKPTAKKKTTISKEKNIETQINEREVKKSIQEENKKERKNPNKTKAKISSKSKKKKEEKAKIVLPKEWQKINETKEKKPLKTDGKISGKIKSSIFEEVDEKTLLIKKEKSKEKIKKTLKKTVISLLFITILAGIIVFLVIKFSDNVNEKFKIYDKYSIGDKVELSDGSIWYVVKDSDSSEMNVKLLKENILDLNKDGKLDDKDKRKYNSDNIAEYDITSDDSAAKYLNETYKKELQEYVGKIEEISLLTSKEYIKIRERMKFGDEWSQGNWLASSDLGNWWIVSERNEKVYVVTSKGTYKLYTAESLNYIRPTIVINKDNLIKIEEPVEDDITENENKD